MIYLKSALYFLSIGIIFHNEQKEKFNEWLSSFTKYQAPQK